MLMNRFAFVFFIVFVLLLNSTAESAFSKDPTEKDAMMAFEYLSGNLSKVISLKEINAKEGVRNGIKFYEMEFKAEIEYIADAVLYMPDGEYVRGIKKKARTMIDKSVKKGTQQKIKGWLTFEYTKKGWRGSEIIFVFITKKPTNTSATEGTKTASLEKQDAEAYIKSAAAYYKNDQYDKAIEDYSKAIAINPNIPEAYNNRGVAYHTSAKLDKAIEDYNKAIALNPNFATAYYNIAGSYSLLGKESVACDSLNKAIEKGYKNLKDIEANTDFDKIRNSNCYKEIQSKIRNEKTKNFFKGLLNNPK